MASCRNQYNYERKRPCGYEKPDCSHMHEDKDDMVLAMAYIKWQKWQKLYKPDEGFCKGTIFEELDLPFYGRRCCSK